jgi:hypothetical protein
VKIKLRALDSALTEIYKFRCKPRELCRRETDVLKPRDCFFKRLNQWKNSKRPTNVKEVFVECTLSSSSCANCNAAQIDEDTFEATLTIPFDDWFDILSSVVVMGNMQSWHATEQLLRCALQRK